MTQKQLLAIAKRHGTPVVVIDHDAIRRNYAAFRRRLPKVQAYYAVKANPAPEIIRTLYRAGASFDVASLPEFMLVHENIQHLPAKERQDFIWDKIIYANPIKPKETLEALDEYKPLLTYDNLDELRKIKRYAPHAGLVLRLRVPNTGSMVELSSKFGCDTGEAVDLILEAFRIGLVVEGLSFHVGSQCTNFDNFVQALNIAAAVMREARSRGHEIKILDIGGGFPVPYDARVKPFPRARPEDQFGNRPAIRRRTSRFWPSRAGSWWPPPPPPWRASSARPSATARPATTSTTACITRSPASCSTTASIASRRSRRARPKSARYSGRPATAWTPSFNPRNCPRLEIDDLLYSENIGAYSNASATHFNGFEPAQVVHVNE